MYSGITPELGRDDQRRDDDEHQQLLPRNFSFANAKPASELKRTTDAAIADADDRRVDQRRPEARR